MESIPDTFIAGIYLLLMSIGGFVEESYRGEPQTKVIVGLRAYQWLCIAGIFIGASLTGLGGPASGLHPPDFSTALTPALIFAFLTALVLGVDFPNSNRRFSRLT